MTTNNLNRDAILTPDIWTIIDTAVQGEVVPIRVAQKVFPPKVLGGAANVPADVFHPETMSIAEGRTKPFIEISIDISLTQTQLDNEVTLNTCQTLAKLAAKSLALAEDNLIFQGAEARLPPHVRVVNRESAECGLLGVARATEPIREKSPQEKPAIFGEEIFRAVTKGIAELNKEGQPGPFALMLESSLYADTYAPLPSSLVTTADRLIPLLPGGFHSSGTLPPATGLLVSLGGEPTTIYRGLALNGFDVLTAYTQEDLEGRHRFRVFERVQFVARDPRALLKLEFRGAA
jgi:uncharacterized linocin/CFP29 family protein